MGLGFGYRLLPYLSVEIRLAFHPQFVFDGQTNFLSPSDPEPVRGETDVLALFGDVVVDFGELGVRLPGGFAPRTGAGMGVAAVWMDGMRLRYPTLAVPHILTTPRGTSVNLAFNLRAGVTRPVGDGFSLLIEYRYIHFGDAATARGQAMRYRPSIRETVWLPIGGTSAPLRAHGLVLGLHWHF